MGSEERRRASARRVGGGKVSAEASGQKEGELRLWVGSVRWAGWKVRGVALAVRKVRYVKRSGAMEECMSWRTLPASDRTGARSPSRPAHPPATELHTEQQ